jgi:chemotaxis protein histidine kinase CheA/ActR/RegA family two-component response regulator
MSTQSEQQQRIMGYFIEEAKDHLNTIETGLLNLQSTIADSEMVNEVFRAAHSVKGGAAMLGLGSIQKTAHRLEDYFKVLRECPVQVDQKLESLFLKVFDTLQNLVDQLQGPFGLTDDKSDEVMANVEPVFASLNEHLNQLVSASGGAPPDEVDLSVPGAAPAPPPPTAAQQEESALLLVFQSDVPSHLRSMLQLFKAADQPDSRQDLQDLCRTLSQAGEQFDLTAWCQLLDQARLAIAHPDNSYRTLAPIVIKELKQAQDMVLAGRSAEIVCSAALQDLVPEAALGMDHLDFGDDLDLDSGLEDLFSDSALEPVTEANDFDLFGAEDADGSPEGLSFDAMGDLNFTDSSTGDDEDWLSLGIEDDGPAASGAAIAADTTFDGLDLIDAIDDGQDLTPAPEGNGPGVGAAELNTLADLFEGESMDLGPWQEEEILDDGSLDDALEPEPSSDFSDLLFDPGEVTPVTAEAAAPSAFDTFIQPELMEEEEAIAPIESEPAAAGDLSLDFSTFDPTPPLADAANSDIVPAAEDAADFLEDLGDLDLFGTADNAPEDEPTPTLADDLDEQMGNLDDIFGLSGDDDPSFMRLGSPAPAASATDDFLADLLSDESPGTADLDLDNLALDDLALDDLARDSDAPTPAVEAPSGEAWDEPGSAAETPSFELDLSALDTPLTLDDDRQPEEVVDLWGSDDEEDDDDGNIDSSEAETELLPPPSPAPTADLDLDQLFDEGDNDSLGDWLSTPEADSDGDLNDLFGDDSDITALLDPTAVPGPTQPMDWDMPELDSLSELPDSLDDSGAFEEAIAAIPDENRAEAAAIDSWVTTDPDGFVDDLFAGDAPDATERAMQDAENFDLTALDLELEPVGLDDTAETTPEAIATDAGLFDHLDAQEELDLDALDHLLDDGEDWAAEPAMPMAADAPVDEPADEMDSFDDLDALLEDTVEAIAPPPDDSITSDDFLELDALLQAPSPSVPAASSDFDDLDALLGDTPPSPPAAKASSDDDFSDFDDLEKLLEDADNTLGGPPTSKGVRRSSPASAPRRTVRRVQSDQTMRVSVRNLDNLNNLIGELVVNRNSLEQTQERLRQFLDNLLYQVQQLSDVGQRMRDLYERSLLESSLLSSRKGYFVGHAPAADGQTHATGANFDALEMDRFTGFHTLSQEMIELIVRVRESASDIDFVVDESDQITRTFRQVTTQLQEGLTRSRMVPFAQTADRLPRAVRDISLQCGKQAELVVEGRDTLIDKMILESLYDPMTHLVNNAITHGIETPAERVAAGKPPVGRITIRSFHQGNQTVISISDDGAGIDADRVKAKAIQKGLMTPQEAKEMTRLDVYDLLFHSGFSTRDKADDFAGRGVGMDVVRTNLTEIRGSINTDSVLGKGTTFTIRLPLTLSISKALCCISNRARIAFPMDGVEDMLDVPRDRIQTDNEGRSCITWREMLLPFQPLSELLSHNRSLGRGSVYGGNQEDEMISVIVLRSSGNFLALQVDQVLGEQEIVIKQLEGPVPKPVGIAGATVLGDGRIMPIADVLELIDLSMGRIRRDSGSSLWTKDDVPTAEAPPTKSEPTVLIVDDSITVRELLSMTFNKVGYRVEQARDGQEAWEKLRSGLPCDLVFCDIEMPRMDGLELLSRIQKDASLADLPIAMLTSRGADRHRQMAITLGAKGYFTKPYLEEALLDAAQRMLKGEVLVGPAG